MTSGPMGFHLKDDLGRAEALRLWRTMKVEPSTPGKTWSKAVLALRRLSRSMTGARAACKAASQKSPSGNSPSTKSWPRKAVCVGGSESSKTLKAPTGKDPSSSHLWPPGLGKDSGCLLFGHNSCRSRIGRILSTVIKQPRWNKLMTPFRTRTTALPKQETLVRGGQLLRTENNHQQQKLCSVPNDCIPGWYPNMCEYLCLCEKSMPECTPPLSCVCGPRHVCLPPHPQSHVVHRGKPQSAARARTRALAPRMCKRQSLANALAILLKSFFSEDKHGSTKIS